MKREHPSELRVKDSQHLFTLNLEEEEQGDMERVNASVRSGKKIELNLGLSRKVESVSKFFTNSLKEINSHFHGHTSQLKLMSRMPMNNKKEIEGSVMGKEKPGSQTSEEKKMIEVNRFIEQVYTNLDEVTENLVRIKGVIERKVDEELQKANKEDSQQETTALKMLYLIFNFLTKNFFPKNLTDLIAEKTPKQIAIFLLDLETKISALPNFINNIHELEQDIATQESFCRRYKYAWDKVVYVQMPEKAEKIEEEITLLKKMMQVTTSAVATERESTDVLFLQKVIFGISFPRFFLASEEANLRCYSIWRNPKVQNLKHVWNLPEEGAIKHMKGVIFPAIKNSFHIYIPREKDSVRGFRREEKNEPKRKGKYRVQAKTDSVNIFEKPEDHPASSVKMLILSSCKITLRAEYEANTQCTCCPCFDTKLPTDFETIVFFIHGGGFVALSCDSVQTYTRRWANSLNVPIFCIDYRKPPEFRFPTAVYDCLAAYEFLVEHLHKYMNVRPKNIILAGDSAGGNLACSLQALLMKKRYPVLPKGLLLAYPPTDLRIRFSPSRLNSFNDPILLPPLLQLCLNEYLGENKQTQFDPLASPLLINQAFIEDKDLYSYEKYEKQECEKWPQDWPKTTIMVGKKDPLYDDSLRLHEKLVRNKIDSKLYIYKQFAHAFLNMDAAIPECSQAIEDSIQELRVFINSE